MPAFPGNFGASVSLISFIKERGYYLHAVFIRNTVGTSSLETESALDVLCCDNEGKGVNGKIRGATGSIPPGFCFILFNWMRNTFCLWKQPNVPDWESRSQALRTLSRAVFRVPLPPCCGRLGLFNFEKSKWTLHWSFRNARKMQSRGKIPSWTKSQ